MIPKHNQPKTTPSYGNGFADIRNLAQFAASADWYAAKNRLTAPRNRA